MVQVLKTSATHGTERRGAKSQANVEEPTQQEATGSSTTAAPAERVAPASAGKAHRQNANII